MLTPKELKDLIQDGGSSPEILLDVQEDMEYEEERKVFNRRFQKRPALIVFCKTTEEVAHVVKIASEHQDYALRVKSGGHDHEAECSATDAIVIDFSKMKDFDLDTDAMTVTLESGLVFKDVIPSFDKAGVSIPHGTCESVGIFGFTLGGGWGPWTRRHGMCCEWLIGATLVLADGTIREIKEGVEEDKELLWALRGGGGYSFGIVTKMVINVFKQPPHTLRFTVSWEDTNKYAAGVAPSIKPAIQILEAWEKVIEPSENIKLIGTNLQIMAIPEDDKSVEKSIHDCNFYGYYAGTEKELMEDLHRWFKGLEWTDLSVVTDENKDRFNFSSWDRISTHNQKLKLRGHALQHFPPDLDHPAPHKLTSRLVQKEGLGKAGREKLIQSLRSALIYKEGIKAQLHTYVTLGAISGHFYSKEYDYPEFPNGSSFPYKERPYTVQYQAWWNETDEDKEAGEEYHVYNYTNDAMDWIEACRANDFPQTSGAFISFKDSSIPTSEYFMESYDALKRIRKKHCNDTDNLFRSRKTIS